MRMRRMLCQVMIPALLGLAASTVPAQAFIDGVSGTTFNFIADRGRVVTPDGGSVPFWGFGLVSAGKPQYPGPTLIVNEGDTVTINLTNRLAEEVSLMIPGVDMVSATVPVFPEGDRSRLASLVPAAAAGGTRSYTFTASRPGTFYYQSGSNQKIQLRMGLFGAIVVRPAQNSTTKNIDISAQRLNDPANPGVAAASRSYTKFAYNDGDGSTGYDREFLFLISEMDPNFQHWVEYDRPLNKSFDFSKWKANYWFINGRAAPDTMAMPSVPWLPNQPYNSMPLFHPGERVLMRLINMGQDFHPFHTHGNHVFAVAEDGRLLSTNPGTAGSDLAWEAFTLTLAPGKTIDGIFEWTGAKLGWDFYDHGADDMPAPYEPLDEHALRKSFSLNTAPGSPPLAGQSLPVVMPRPDELTLGLNWSGSPFLGSNASLPVGEGGFNTFNGFFYMWHSHSERELTNNNIFPGGLLTMAGVVPWPMGWPLVPDNLDTADMYVPPTGM